MASDMMSPPLRSRFWRMRSGKMRMPEKRLSMRWEDVAGEDAGFVECSVYHDAGGAVGFVLGLHGFEGEGDERADLGCAGDDVLGEFWVALLGHGAAADCAFGDGFFDFAEFLFHLGIDFSADFAACGGEKGEDGDVFGEVVADGAAGVCHGCHAESPGDAVLDV